MNASLPTEQSVTLYDHEQYVQALMDTEALVAPSQEAEFEHDLMLALQRRDEKREAVLKFFGWMDSQTAACEKEIDRIKAFKERIENARRRLKRYVANVILAMGQDAKGKYKKLDSYTGMMYVRALPQSVDILDDLHVPNEYKHVTLKMPVTLWHAIIEALPQMDLREVQTKDVSIDKEAVENALVNGKDVPGADLRLAGHAYTLVVK